MQSHDKTSQAKAKPHLWHSEMPLLVDQALRYVSGQAVSDETLADAKYRRDAHSWRGPDELIYHRYYGGRSAGDHTLVAFVPQDNLFSDRASFTMGIKDIVEEDLAARVSECLLARNFTKGDQYDDLYIAYANASQNIEVFVYAKDGHATVSIRKANR